jgi:hypothetical protein
VLVARCQRQPGTALSLPRQSAAFKGAREGVDAL